MNQDRIYCKKCIYYYVTWNGKMPNGCKKWGIKSSQMPSIVIKNSTGEDCQFFNQRSNRG